MQLKLLILRTKKAVAIRHCARGGESVKTDSHPAHKNQTSTTITMNTLKLSAALALLFFIRIGRADPLDTWILSSPLPQIGLSAIAYAQEEFVAVGWPGAIVTSADGVNWVQRQSSIQAGTNSELYGIAYGNGQFVAVGVNANIGGTI